MKSLKTLQNLAKAGKIISKILFILSIVGACCIVLSLISVIAFKDTILEGVSFADKLQEEVNLNMASIYLALICATIACIIEAITCKMAEKYFRYQLSAGTPFTYEGASKMFKLGIWLIILPLIYAFVCCIVHIIFVLSSENVIFKGYGYTSMFGLGLGFVIISCIFKYGADISTESINKIEKSDEDIIN